MVDLPKTYRAATVVEVGKPLEIRDVELKQPTEGQVLVKMLASGVCHSDSIVTNAQMGVQLPRVPGHEIIGKVVAVGPGEKKWKVGQRVGSGWHGGHCGICDRCRAGDFVTCKSENINGIITDGGHAEYVILRTEAIASIPEDISSEEAAPLLCAGVTVYNAMRNQNLMPGDIVGVQGVGGLGHLAIQFARASGYRTVAISRGTDKEKLARELGAHDYIDSEATDAGEALRKMGGAKLIIAVAPSGKAMSSLIPALGVDGQLLIIAVADDLTIPCGPMIMKRLSVKGWPSGTAKDSEDTIDFATQAGVKCKIETYKLDQINEAFDSMMKGTARFRAVIKFDE